MDGGRADVHFMNDEFIAIDDIHEARIAEAHVGDFAIVPCDFFEAQA